MQISRSLPLSSLHDRCSYREVLTEASRLWRPLCTYFWKATLDFICAPLVFCFSLPSKLWYWWSRTQKQGQQMSREAALLLGVFIIVFYLIRQILFASFFCCYLFLLFKKIFLSTLSHTEEVNNVKSVWRMLSFLLVARKSSCVYWCLPAPVALGTLAGRCCVLMKMNSVNRSRQLGRQQLWASMSFIQTLHNVAEQEAPRTQITSKSKRQWRTLGKTIFVKI